MKRTEERDEWTGRREKEKSSGWLLGRERRGRCRWFTEGGTYCVSRKEERKEGGGVLWRSIKRTLFLFFGWFSFFVGGKVERRDDGGGTTDSLRLVEERGAVVVVCVLSRWDARTAAVNKPKERGE